MLNHLAFQGEDAVTGEKLAVDVVQHGRRLMFPELHPYADARQHYAAFLESADGFEVDLVAIDAPLKDRRTRLICNACSRPQ